MLNSADQEYRTSLNYLAGRNDAVGMALVIHIPKKEFLSAWQKLHPQLVVENATFSEGQYEALLPNGGRVILDGQ
jgi:hypothetical protein